MTVKQLREYLEELEKEGKGDYKVFRYKNKCIERKDIEIYDIVKKVWF